MSYLPVCECWRSVALIVPCVSRTCTCALTCRQTRKKKRDENLDRRVEAKMNDRGIKMYDLWGKKWKDQENN